MAAAERAADVGDRLAFDHAKEATTYC
jgi:hypothetical protein